MKTAFLETVATALLVATEAFVFGFGAVWIALTAIAGGSAWFGPSMVGGITLAAWSACAVLKMAANAATQEQQMPVDDSEFQA